MLSMQWTLSVIAQSMTVLLGMALGAYVFMQEQATRAHAHLRRKQLATGRDLASILPALVKNYLELRSDDPYWHAVWRKLMILALALNKMQPELPHHMDRLVGWRFGDTALGELDADAYERAARLSAHPEQFLKAINGITNLAPLEPGYPQRSVLSHFHRVYAGEVGRHVRALERQRWASNGYGRVLPGILVVTIFMAALLLSLTGRPALVGLIGWGTGIVMALSAMCLTLFTVLAYKLISPAGSQSLGNRILRLRTELRRGRLSA